MKTGWVADKGKWYYLDKTGAMKTGWILDNNNKWYYLDGSGAMKTGWILDKGKWYLLDKSGQMLTGWVHPGGTWYYLERSGAMKTGWLWDKNKWYYLDDSGAMRTGWVKTGGKWYLLDGSGAMRTGWVKAGRWYYLDKSGAMKTGWLKDNGKWYYLNSNGDMATGWAKDGGRWYYLDGSGAMKTGTDVLGKTIYHFGPDGALRDAYTRNLSNVLSLSGINRDRALTIIKNLINIVQYEKDPRQLCVGKEIPYNDYTKIYRAISNDMFFGETPPIADIRSADDNNIVKTVYMTRPVDIIYSEMKNGRDLEDLLNRSLKNSGANSAGSVYEKVRRINNYICSTVSYDYDCYYGNSDYLDTLGVIRQGRAICSGYARYFYKLCTKAGIRCQIIHGEANGGDGWGSHAWNRVYEGGRWKNVDVTFNDTGENWSEYLLDSYLWGDHSGGEVVEDNNL